MNRCSLFCLALSLLLLSGCGKDKQADEENPVIPEVRYVITLSSVPDVIVSIEGARRSFTFLISVNTDDGLVVSNKTVQTRIDAGPGDLSSAEVTTNALGMAQSTYTSLIPTGNTLVRLVVECDAFDASQEFHIISLPRPAVVELSTLNPDRIAVEGQDVQMDIVALLTDADGNAVSGVSLKFEIEPLVEGGGTFGLLSSAGVTDADGMTHATFRSGGGFGREKISCHVDEPDGYLEEVRDEIAINIESLNDKISSFTIAANPDYLIVSSAEPESSTVTVNLRDADRFGIEGVSVNVTTDVGYIVGRAVTDELGRASVQYIVEFHNLADTTQGAHISAQVPGTDWHASAFIILTPEGAGRATLRLTTDTRSIMADNGRTVAHLTATLLNRFLEPIAGQPVVFTTTHGLAQSPVSTDANGVARSIFTDIGIASVDENGNPDSAVVRARVDELNAMAQVKIMILPWDEIGELEALEPEHPVEVGGVDSVLVRCRVLRPNGELLGDGIVVHFEPTRGIVNPRHAVTRDGVASTWYYSPYTSGPDSVLIWTLYNGNRFETKTAVQVLPGPPTRGSGSSEGGPLTAGDSTAFVNIFMTVFDSYDNPVPGVTVCYSASLGVLTREAPVTDARGVAATRLYAGDIPGLAIVTICMNTPEGPLLGTMPFTILAPTVGRIECSLDHTNLAVGGQDETSSAHVIVRLLSLGGILVEEPYPVVLEVLNDLAAPHNCYFNDDEALLRIVTPSSQGLAVATLNAGDSLGIRILRAYTWTDEAQEDTVEGLQEFRVVPGEASTIRVNLNPLGIDTGGAWLLETWADARDARNFPVAAGTEVLFRVDSEIAAIQESGVVFRPGYRGYVLEGRAYTTLVYSSQNTFGDVNIEARIPTTRHGVVSNSLDLLLPLQQGQLSLTANPGNWNFGADGDTAQIVIVATLRDGHRSPINFGSVEFSPQRGTLYWRNAQTEQLERLRDNIRITGLNNAQNNEEPGQATVYLVGGELNFFAAPENPEDPNDNVLDIQVGARLQGYADVIAEPVTIRFVRPAQ